MSSAQAVWDSRHSLTLSPKPRSASSGSSRRRVGSAGARPASLGDTKARGLPARPDESCNYVRLWTFFLSVVAALALAPAANGGWQWAVVVTGMVMAVSSGGACLGRWWWHVEVYRRLATSLRGGRRRHVPQKALARPRQRCANVARHAQREKVTPMSAALDTSASLPGGPPLPGLFTSHSTSLVTYLQASALPSSSTSTEPLGRSISAGQSTEQAARRPKSH